jgi:hypothetical protein
MSPVNIYGMIFFLSFESRSIGDMLTLTSENKSVPFLSYFIDLKFFLIYLGLFLIAAAHAVPLERLVIIYFFSA